MILNCLYSDTNLINPISFKMGLNIVLGKYSDNVDKKNINGIGKSSFVRLIAYLLLSDTAEKTFLKNEYDFLREEKHSISLEFNVKNKHFVIKRSFSNNNEIFLGEKEQNITPYIKSEVKNILLNNIFPIEQEDITYEGNRLGTLMDFFVRDDMKNLQRFDPLVFSKGLTNKTEQYIFNFFLLGLQTSSIIKFCKISDKKKELNSEKTTLSKKVKDDTGKTTDEFKTEKIKIERNINRIEDGIKNYTFLENYKSVENDLIEISTTISEKLKEYNTLYQKLTKVKKSYQFEHKNQINISEIKIMYNEILDTFGELVSKKLNDIIEFKKDILTNRNRILKDRENMIQESIDCILSEISVLEKKRSEMYKLLEEKEALDSIKNAYEELTKEKTLLAENMNIVRKIDDLTAEIATIQVSISEIQLKIQNILREEETQIEDYRKLFFNILQSAISFEDNIADGHFSISIKDKIKSNGLPFDINVSIPKMDSLGMSRLKIFVYDLMVFLNNIQTERILPHFLIHDGMFHGISNETIAKALNYIYHKCLQFPSFQYFATFNEDEIPNDNLEFDLQNIVVATYRDNPEDMIFKREFY